MRTKKNYLLEGFRKIQEAANKSEDGQRCLIAPHPDLKKKLNEEMKKLEKGLKKSVLSKKVKMGVEYTPVGFNDGLIYPGTEFPVGTSARVARSAAAKLPPLKGKVKVIVVLVEFSDQVMTKTKSHFEDLFFSEGVVKTGSVREYFREVSHDIIDMVGEVTGPYRLPLSLAQYAHGDSGTGEAAPNARTMALDAAQAANPHINFKPYDNNGDGYVDAFVIIHAGTGAETTGSTGDIWSHKWVLPNVYNADTIKIFAYLTVPEDCKIGVCAHELGHLIFGFPDLYDADNSSEGIGNWCLMAGGSWNNNGLTPAHPCAWCKAEQNWVTVQRQKKNQKKVSIKDVKKGFKVFRLWKNGDGGSEYFLVENRQKTQYDKFLPKGGLLIWHIDDAVSDNTSDAHYKVALKQADGNKDLELNVNRGDDGDVYPGSSRKKIFNELSNPNSKSYAGSRTNVSVLNISASGTTMYADLHVKSAIPGSTKTAKKAVKKTAGKTVAKKTPK